MPNIRENAEYSAIWPNILHNLTFILSEYSLEITENSGKWPNIRHFPNIRPPNEHSYEYEDSEVEFFRACCFRAFQAFGLLRFLSGFWVGLSGFTIVVK